MCLSRVKEIYKRLYLLQILIGIIPPVLFIFWKVDVLRAVDLLLHVMDVMTCSIDNASIVIMAYILFASLVIAKLSVFIIAIIISCINQF